jgi:hypothetical protein
MTGLMDAPQTLLNTVSTNVPGPQIPLYLHGHKQLHWYPLGICSANIGLFVAILTYNQQLTFGATVDARQVPDPWAFAACVREAYDELKAAASAIDATAAGPAAPRRSLPPQPRRPLAVGSIRQKGRERSARGPFAFPGRACYGPTVIVAPLMLITQAPWPGFSVVATT